MAILSTVSVSRALDGRVEAARFTDLRLAVLTVASAETRPDAIEDLNQLDDSLNVLGGNHDAVFDRLSPADRPVAEADLVLLISHGRMLLDDGHIMSEHEHDLVAHSDLEEILRTSALEAAGDAAAKERTSALSGLAMIGTLALAASQWLANRSRVRAGRDRADALHEASTRFEWLLDDSPEAAVIIDPSGEITYQAASMAELFPGQPLNSRQDLVALACDGHQPALAAHLRSAGMRQSLLKFQVAGAAPDERRDFIARASDLREDPLIGGWLVSFRDVSAETQAQRDLEGQVRTDILTGLPNRLALMEDLNEVADSTFDFLLIDLDDFRMTNDTLGHEAGDELLQIVARRLRGALQESDRLYRLGGDEFAAIVVDDGTDRVLGMPETLRSEISMPARLTAGVEQPAASIGVATSQPGASPVSVFHRADIALSEAKAKGGSGVQRVHEALEARAHRRRELGRALDRADLGEFRLVYQPIVSSETGREFIALAEQSGRIVDLGWFVIETACEHLSEWRSGGLMADVGITVNVSPRQLTEAGFAERVCATIDQHGLDASDLTVEITESALVTGQRNIIETLTDLRSSGVRVACDDFGSGYSNLGQLLALPLDLLKADRGLLIRLSQMRDASGGDTRQACEIMAAIVQIANAVQVPVVAEGVEMPEQQLSLHRSGVQLLQGYFFSRPVERHEVPHVIEHTPGLVSVI